MTNLESDGTHLSERGKGAWLKRLIKLCWFTSTMETIAPVWLNKNQLADLKSYDRATLREDSRFECAFFFILSR